MSWVLDGLGVILVCCALLLLSFASRRRWITRAGGTFDCSLRLQARHAEQLIIVGCAAPFCIDDTVTGAFDRQYRNFIVSDAIGYFDKEFLENSLRRIAMKYGRFLTTEQLLAEMGV